MIICSYYCFHIRFKKSVFDDIYMSHTLIDNQPYECLFATTGASESQTFNSSTQPPSISGSCEIFTLNTTTNVYTLASMLNATFNGTDGTYSFAFFFSTNATFSQPNIGSNTESLNGASFFTNVIVTLPSGATANLTYTDYSNAWYTTQGSSYFCDSALTYQTPTGSVATVSATITEVQAQAFPPTQTTSFYPRTANH